MKDCGAWNKVCGPGEWIAYKFDKAVTDFVEGIVEAVGKAIGTVGTIWVNIDTPVITQASSAEVSITAGESASDSGNIDKVIGYIMALGLSIAVLSIIALGALLQ